jgi:phage terminase large subunit-like protein
MTHVTDRPAPVKTRRGGAVGKRKPAAVADRTTDYCHRVLNGDLIAGPHVRAACRRHLADLDQGPARGLIWSLPHAQRAIEFFEEILRLNGGQFEGLPFKLQPWQAFVVGSLFGWLRGDVRRFRVAYVETGKGSGKSPLAAGVGHYGLTADGEARAEIYAAATKKDQAMVLFRDAVAMFDQSPELRARLVPSGQLEKVWNLAYPATGSFFRCISADDGQSGPRPHIALVDEHHEHKTNAVVELLRAGTKSRRQALIFIITNSGAGATTPCGQYHDRAIAVAEGKEQDDALFSYVCGLDEGEDPLRDEACWPKANPSLQLANLPGVQYLREQVTEAIGMPGKEALVRRLNFCQWTGALNPWLSAHVWDPCRASFSVEQLRGRRAYGGLDLSSTTDLTAFVLLVEPLEPGEPWSILPWAWLPEQGLRDRSDRDRVDYLGWVKSGHLEATPGAAISKRHVLQRVAQICAEFDVQTIAADRWRMADFKQIAQDEGITLPELLDFGQGFKDMSPALDAFETAILNRTLQHNGHPVLTMCCANAVTDTDPAGNRKLNKVKATGRIDLAVAAVMAYASAAKPVEAPLGDYVYVLDVNEAQA